MRVRPFRFTVPAALLVMLAHAALAAPVDYRIDMGIEYNDNVNLSQDDPLSAWALRPAIGFGYSEHGSTIQTDINGRVEHDTYLSGPFADKTLSQLTGVFNWSAVPERLNFSVLDTLAVAPINALQPNTPVNQQQTNVIGFGPTLLFRMGAGARGEAQLSYINSYASKTDQYDTSRIAANLRAIRDLSQTSAGSLNLEYQTVDFTHEDSAPVPNYYRYSAFARYVQKLASVDFTADAGYSWLKWRSGNATDYSGALLAGKVDWRLDPDNTLGFGVARRYSDAAEGALITPGATGTPLQSIITIGDATVTAAPYLEHMAQLTYTYTGTRAHFSVSPQFSELDYLSIGNGTLPAFGGNQIHRRFMADYSWRFTPATSIGATAMGDIVSYNAIDRRDRDTTIAAYLTHLLSPHWSWQVTYSWYRRASSVANQSATNNIVYFGFTYTR